MFIEAEIGFMVRYTIENNKYEGNRINYSSCESPKLTSTTLNTNVITWDKLEIAAQNIFGICPMCAEHTMLLESKYSAYRLYGKKWSKMDIKC